MRSNLSLVFSDRLPKTSFNQKSKFSLIVQVCTSLSAKSFQPSKGLISSGETKTNEKWQNTVTEETARDLL